MKIGIDGTTLNIPFPCGVKHYSEQLLFSLAKIDKDNQYIIFAKKDVNIPNQDNFQLVQIPTYLPILKRQFFITYYAKKMKVDIFHCLEAFGPIFLNDLRVISTVHDLDLGKVYPTPKNPVDYFHRKYAKFIRYRNLSNSHHLIAVSKTIQKDLEKYLDSTNLEIAIDVVYEAPHSRFRKKRVKNKKYFLAMGDFSPRKNIPRVLSAYSMLPKAIKSKHRLKLVASTERTANEFQEMVSGMRLKDNPNIELAPNLDRLVNLYNKSIAFIYPSLYEGFGLPILEAMRCGCPVVTSSEGATREVAGQAAILVNPRSSREISKAMRNISEDKNLSQKLAREGLKRSGKFSWERNAMETLNLYKKLRTT